MEEVILLDEGGRSIGLQDKSTVHTQATPLHLAFSCYVFDADGRFLMSRRSLRKRTWPGIWTNSFCGHPAPAERLVDAVRRRAEAELGMALADVKLVLPRFRYRAELDGVVENEMCPVFTARAASVPQPNPDEVQETEWVSWVDFTARAMVAQSRLSPWCRLQIAELQRLGASPYEWPAADAAELPDAARSQAPAAG